MAAFIVGLITVVLMREREQIHGSLSDLPNRMLSSMLADLGRPVTDLLPKMRSAAAARPPLWHDVVEGHLSPEGHRLVAEMLIDQLRKTYKEDGWKPFGASKGSVDSFRDHYSS